ncbi:hypothetical protein B0H63DRAFT_522609 [Podospora didyma]|uniref:Uncharacterized protein n=1 Tax=Podospora didyma TaxID=330526 RepID=A0AAE0NPK1_9PEZI|nr:hypothetical protein B0H63DRAFT_522609 [Podospora didyma]
MTGTASSIIERALALNPEFGALSARTAEVMLALWKAATVVECFSGVFVRFDQCLDGLGHLRQLGSAWCGASANSCSRVSCSNNCGIFLCNTSNHHFRAHCEDIANDMKAARSGCGKRERTGSLR